MGWYIAAIFVWWLVSSIFDLISSGVQGLISMMTVTTFLYVGWWLPYTSWIAFGEFHFFWKYPDKRAPFFIFAGLSLICYSLLIFLYPKWSGSWPFLVLPAAAVTVMYLARRTLRGGATEDQRASAQGRLAKAIVLLGITGAIVATYKHFIPRMSIVIG